MSRKSKGINAEREVIKLFAETGNWFACRVAGSGSSRFPAPDIIAGNRLRKLALECKASRKKSKYLTKEEVSQLKEFSATFGAEPWVAIRFDRRDWLFLTVEDIQKTEKNYVITEEMAKNKGLSFEELIK